MANSHSWRDSRLRLAAIICTVVALVTGASVARAQATGVIKGTVVDASGSAAIAEVQVFVVGIRRGTITSESGRFVITGVPLGESTVRAQKLGFAPAQTTVTVSASDTATVTFRLSQAALALEEIVVTGTAGAAEKRTLGNDESTVHAAQLTETVPVPNVAELLQGRAAGINVVTNSGAVGTTANIRIRGAGSLSANTKATSTTRSSSMFSRIRRSRRCRPATPSSSGIRRSSPTKRSTRRTTIGVAS